MSDLIPFGNIHPQTMSSQEISTLTGKKHSHVCRDIRNMLDQIIKNDDPNLDHKKIQGVIEERDARGYVTAYHLDRDHTYTLIAGYKADLRFKIIQRWQTLEAKAAMPQPLTPSIPEALLAQAQAIVDQHHRLDAHDAAIAAHQHRIGILENTVITMMQRSRQRHVEALNTAQRVLDFEAPGRQRTEYQGGHHASPRPHARRAHYRQLADGRRVEVRASFIGQQSRKGETLQ